MNSEQALNLVSAIVFLAIALVAALRRARSPLAIHLGLMGACLFAYHLFELISTLHQPRPWDWAEDAAAAFSAIPTLDLFLGFVGMRRRLRWLRRATAVYFTTIAAMSLWRFVEPSFFGDAPWALMMLAGVVVVFAVAGVCLVRHVRQSRGLERARAQLLLGSMLLGVGGVTTDLSALAGANVPKLAAVGLMIASLLVAALILRARVLEGISGLLVGNAAVVAALAVVAQLVAVAYARTNTALAVVGTVVVAVATVSVLRPMLATLHEHRARAEYLATLGRFAEQMAHDLRNPVAAIRGAAQFLQEEHAQGRSMDEHVQFIELIVERTQRLERVIAEYQRIGRVEPRLEAIDVDVLVRDLVASEPWGEGVSVECALDEGLPAASADRDLLCHALENLLRNACEAMPDGGKLEVRCERVAESDSVRITVADDGPGMDARTRERALEQFFTTKASGSGLGLALVARVVEAHGGKLELHSQLGEGTRVAIELPGLPGASSRVT
jgi:signal transduction histidine kinase